ncbi:MAG: site-2 protease family protein [Acidobacteriota bacterium]|nr:site-2 protease family protein [Acidobacteriota bacterium]
MQPLQVVIAVFEFVLLIFSLSVHECAHAWTASRLGDHTAELEGRITLNPMYHIDPIGSLLIPGLAIFGPLVGFTFLSGVLIGWAKPTPVISRNLQKIVRDENLITLAGPASNLLIVLAAFLVLVVISFVVPGGHTLVTSTFEGGLTLGVQSNTQAIILLAMIAILINLSLFIFNLLPVPPLDGSHLLRNMLPYNAVQAYDRIPYWLSWILMLVIGGFIINLFVGPAMRVIYLLLHML